uniref:CD99 antigen-like protein 2 n=1 Tax=Catharus ustulatus TaxID=91951 RepID=A0A8C3V7U1_CATUS
GFDSVEAVPPGQMGPVSPLSPRGYPGAMPGYMLSFAFHHTTTDVLRGAEGCRDTDGVVSLQVPVATPTTTTAAVGVTVDGETEGVVCVPITKLSLCPTVAETGTIAGIASGLVMALIGAVSSYISYQQKKFCFSIQQGLNTEYVKGENMEAVVSEEPQVKYSVLETQSAEPPKQDSVKI